MELLATKNTHKCKLVEEYNYKEFYGIKAPSGEFYRKKTQKLLNDNAVQ